LRRSPLALEEPGELRRRILLRQWRVEDQPQAGLASGLLNTSRLLGGALGLALLGTLAATHTANAGGGPLTALTDGFQFAFVIGALLPVSTTPGRCGRLTDRCRPA
jgi:hypothetical protein